MIEENCVVLCEAVVPYIRLTNANLHRQRRQLLLLRQQLQQQQQQQKQKFAKITDKSYYIELPKYDHKLVQSENSGCIIRARDGPLLSSRQFDQSNWFSIWFEELSYHSLESTIAQIRGLLISNDHKKGNTDVDITHDTHLDCYNDEFTKLKKTHIIDELKKNSSLFVISEQNRSLSLPFLLLLLVLVSNQNALPCFGYRYSEHYDNTGFTGYNYPRQSPNLNSSIWNNHNRHNNPHRNYVRHLNDDSMEMMPTSMDRYIQDQSGPPQGSFTPTLNSWKSMLTDAFNDKQDTLDTHIKNILIPRVSGTQGNIKIREYIVNSLKVNNYHIELDEFTDSTPIGDIKFSNIIASSNPKACRQLILACHYDSKMMDGFLGATDSAVPCAILLKISETFHKSFRPSFGEDDEEDPKNSLGLRFIFFDGEEAYGQWSPTDSLYGSRHLAEKWNKQPTPQQCLSKAGKSELSRIELFVLLDLIGSSDTSFVMYNRQLQHHYNSLQKYEKLYLSKMGLGVSQMRAESAFKNRFVPLDFVEDDHVPFKKRGVPILSLLAHPFPKVWHTIDDNYNAIDFARTRRILHVLEEFVANYTKG